MLIKVRTTVAVLMTILCMAMWYTVGLIIYTGRAEPNILAVFGLLFGATGYSLWTVATWRGIRQSKRILGVQEEFARHREAGLCPNCVYREYCQAAEKVMKEIEHG